MSDRGLRLRSNRKVVMIMEDEDKKDALKAVDEQCNWDLDCNCGGKKDHSMNNPNGNRPL